jgi:hypothetical protein
VNSAELQDWEERAAIMEYDGGLPRHEAERLATERMRAQERPVTCGTCRRFERTSHPHLGHCAAGEPESPQGLWDTDRRRCAEHRPL